MLVLPLINFTQNFEISRLEIFTRNTVEKNMSGKNFNTFMLLFYFARLPVVNRRFCTIVFFFA